MTKNEHVDNNYMQGKAMNNDYNRAMEKTWKCDKCNKKILHRDVYLTEKIDAEDGYSFYQTVAYCSKKCYDDSIYIKCRWCGNTFHRDNGYEMAGCRVEYCSRSCERLADP